MHQVKADPSRQILHLTITSKIEISDAPKILAQLRQEIVKLKPGYVAAIDLRGLTVINPELGNSLQEFQNILVAGQPKKVGTLLSSAVLKMQINQSGQKTGINPNAQRFDNEAEWKKFLGL